MNISLDGHSLTLDAVERVAHGARATLTDDARKQMESSRAWIANLERRGDAAPAVYGINTGFGSLKSTVFSISEAKEVSYRLIVSHCCGTGAPFATEVVRAAMLLRANSLAQGFSGVRPVVVETLLEMLNRGVTPVVPSQGSLGASGDLSPLSHLALVMIKPPSGESPDSGIAEYNSERLSGAEAMRRAGIERLELEAKEGLALNNGVQFMCGSALLTLQRAERLLKLQDAALAMHVDAIRGASAAFDARIAGLRKYSGHAVTAANVRGLLEGSSSADNDKGRIQDAYSIRCAPQIAGAVRDGLRHVREGLEIEINSVTDNPLIFAEDDQSLSGGNFHGDPVGLRVDYMKTLLTELGNLSERRINRFMDRTLNGGLGPYLLEDKHVGRHSGLMITSYTAAALTSENKVLAHPACVDTIPTSENQEDIVSMGTHGARHAAQILENVEHIVAIELLCAAQALDRRKQLHPVILFGKGSEAVHRAIRAVVPAWKEDHVMAGDIDTVHRLVSSGELLRQLESVVELQ
ncbi:MAG: histidine ammonia-lyase [Calditrichaeota bacterium]|nr:histidine ammonia-lyase [Calditrichota bacterium]MCB9391106.1 histidine ammonia-lyase [Calditrichota bacterium]